MGSPHQVVEIVLMIIGLLLVAAATRALSKRLRFPFTVALVLAGAALAQLSHLAPAWLGVLGHYALSPDVILFVFLPTLIYESAMHLNARQLRHNLLPVLTLAIPGLICSTAVIGLIVWACTPIDLAAALLLGAILSATDPVAVISLFSQLGAPKRLSILVEGESLFNDATSIVVARILMTIVAAGYFAPGMALQGALAFVVVFFGGLLVGAVAAWGTGLLLGKVESDPFIEISMTTILAYLSFMLAEEVFQVSGVMATVAAGITMGNWGRTKVSPSVAGYLEHFWEYLAYVANALIFLMVGLRIDPGALWESLDLLAWVVLAMLVSRALIIFGLVPLAGCLPGARPVSAAYRAVMFWGGLRGAIALAIVLSLEDFAYAETFIALVTGAVLFTLVVQGTTIEMLVRWLGLDRPPLADRVARSEGLLAAKQNALDHLPELQRSGLFSARIAGRLKRRCQEEIAGVRAALDRLRSAELDAAQSRTLLFCRCFAEERNGYYDLFGKGHLSEQAYRDLCYSLDLQEEAVRARAPLPRYTLHSSSGEAVHARVSALLEKGLSFCGLPEQLRVAQVAREYEEAWGRAQGSARILAELAAMAGQAPAGSETIAEVRDYYAHWCESARQHLDLTANQFPEFVNAMQESLAGRLLLHAQREVIAAETRAGIIPREVADKMLAELAGEIRRLRGSDLRHLQVAAGELLRKVPFFSDLPEQDFVMLSAMLHPFTAPAGRIVIRQGALDDSLYLISRGVIRVAHTVGDREEDLATLMAGDFFGEMALLHGEPRTATCWATTPAALYELRRSDFEAVCQICPALQSALEDADRKRSLELSKHRPRG